ncbi:unnamed protein product [Larinioides sclopetarius]|uniref:Deoxyuridine 5'-triphosphate nucleotidohydrolase n=1 Tax=Larinioides sclopetarius TaxID=280406 RepID=A0AAV2C2C7_9ARAC
MSASTSQDISFKCEPIVQLMDTLLQGLHEGKADVTIPKALSSILYFYFFQQMDKPKCFPKIPEETIFIDMIKEPTKSIEIINSIIKKDTNGFVDKLDEGTEYELKDPDFDYLVMSILYLKGRWNGEVAGSFSFYNGNGIVKENVPFFKLSRLVAEVENDKIIVGVPYRSYGIMSDSYIYFSMPLQNKNEKYHFVNVYLPKFTTQRLLKINNEFGKYTLNLKYKQDEKGFEAAVMNTMFARTKPGAYIPERRDLGSIGYDLRTPNGFYIKPQENLKIDTGIAFEMDLKCNFFPKIFDKSSVAANKKVNVQGGVIDPNYRGSIIVALRNNGPEIIHFRRGDAIAQIVFLNFVLPTLTEVETINVDTDRGKRGFGGTTFL